MRESAERALIWIVVITLFASVIGVTYLVFQPSTQPDPHTEFYLLGENNSTDNFPTNLTVGETGSITVGITNNEHKQMDYTIVLLFDGEITATEMVQVPNGETREQQLQFTPESSGRKTLRILLFRVDGGTEELYRDAKLSVKVRET